MGWKLGFLIHTPYTVYYKVWHSYFLKSSFSSLIALDSESFSQDCLLSSFREKATPKRVLRLFTGINVCNQYIKVLISIIKFEWIQCKITLLFN